MFHRLRLGVLFGDRILVVVYHGRRSGIRHLAALEAVGYEPGHPADGHPLQQGAQIDWYRTITAARGVEI